MRFLGRISPGLIGVAGLAMMLSAPFAPAQEASSEKAPAAADEPTVVAESIAEIDPFPPYPGLEPEVFNQIKVFFLLVQRGKVDAAYDALVKGTVIEPKPEDVAVLREKTKQAIQLFGEIRGYEIIELRRVGEHLLNVVVVSLGEKYPLRWKLYFYHSRDAWRLIDIRVDDRLVSLFGEEDTALPAAK